MFKRIFSSVTVIILLLALCSCVAENNDVSESSSSNVVSDTSSENKTDINSSEISSDGDFVDNSIDNSSIDDATSDITNNAAISIKEIADNEISAVDRIIFKDENVSYINCNILFSVNSPITNFKFFSINDEYFMDSTEAVTSPLVIDEILYTISSITPEKDIVISTYINDAVANRGVSFTDANGVTHYFSINYNTIGLPDTESIYLAKINIE